MPIPKSNSHSYSKSSREIVYEGLNDWIMDGTLVPGEKISDLEVAEYFAVSRTPVREAIQMLANQKLIVVEPGKGSYVAPLDPDTILQVYQMMAELHASAVDICFDKIDDSVIEEMIRINELVDEAYKAEDPILISKMDTDFHNIYIELAGNIFLKSFNEELAIHARRYRNLHFTDIYMVKASHQDIIDAFRERNRERAMKAVRDNWTLTEIATKWAFTKD